MAYKDGREWARSFITVKITDKDGLLSPRAGQGVRFTVEGPGELVATDNGDATSFESFQSPERAAFNGLVLAIIRARPGATGAIPVRATADGLQDGSVTIKLKAGHTNV